MLGLSGVLILVLVDHTLGEADFKFNELKLAGVLILVLVDHTLGEQNS